MTQRWGRGSGGTAVRLRALAFAASVALLGCASNDTVSTAQRLVQEGKAEQALEVLKSAMREDPSNEEYRAQYFRQREIVVTQLLAQAEAPRVPIESADALYRRVLALDGSNARAMAGLQRLQTRKRHAALVAEAEGLKAKDAEAALARLRLVLSQDPNHREARALQRQLLEQQASARLERPALKSRLTQPISLELRDVPIRSVFEIITGVTGINFMFDKDVRPELRATVFVKDTDIEDVIRSVLMTNQLETRIINEKTVLVYPNTPAKAREYQELVVKTFYLTNAEAKHALNLIRTILKTRDVYVDDKLNMLVMRDTPENVRMAERLIVSQDLAEPEVVLEVEVMEIKRSRFTELGIQYPNQFTVLNLASSNTVTTSAGTVVATTPQVVTNPLTLETLRNVNSSRIGITPLVANLRKEEGDANLLANPRIRVKNRDKARILIGDRVPVITTTATANVGVTESVNYLDVGLKLDVEPSITLDDDVVMKVSLEVSSIVREIKSSTGTLTYQIGTRSASTGLRLRDGETQALAGLINDEDRKSANKIPGLGDLPVIGRLFSSHRTDATKTEIILLITPHIVRNLLPPESAYTDFTSGTEMSTGSGALGVTSSAQPAAPGTAAPGPAPASAPRAPPQQIAPPAGAPAPSPFRRGR